jgi:hypothetical protein
MRMNVAMFAVFVFVNMDLAALDDFSDDVHSKHQEHYADAEFKYPFGLFADLEIEQKNGDTGKDERDRVAKSPQTANDRRTPKALAFRDDRRNGRQVIAFDGVFEPDKKPKSEHA